MAKRTVPVSERALVQRINRKYLSMDGPPARELKKTRGTRAKLDLGDYFILNTARNFIDHHHIEPEELGRELGVLNEWEYVVEDEKGRS